MKTKTEIVDPKVVRRLSIPSTTLSTFNILLDWVTIIGLAFLCTKYFHPLLYIPVVMIIACRQHGMLILMHDSSHSRLYSNKKLNDVVGELFLAWPLFIKMIGYRERHLAHHAYANSPKDPDFVKERYITTRKEIYKQLLGDVTGFNTKDIFKEIKKLQVKCSTEYKVYQLMFYAALITGLTVSGLWKAYLLFWIIPCFTWLKVLLRLRAIADHTGVHNREKPFDTRTIIPNLFDRVFVAPHYCSYHLGHHAFMTIPCYKLKEFHNELVKSPIVQQKAHFSKGFIGFLNEFPYTTEETAAYEAKTGLTFTEKMPAH
jgi:fatty acid desaturase